MKKRIFFINLITLICLFSRGVYAQEIKYIKIEGNTILESEIDDLVSSYQSQGFGLQNLKKLTTEITNLYVKKGYKTSGAFVPRQEFVDGIVRIQIIEGKLTNVEIKGLKYLKKSYINSRFRKVTQGIYKDKNLRKALESLYVDPLIEKVDAKLVYGDDPASNFLFLEIQEASLVQSSLEINNQASPTIGEVRGIGQISHQSVLGFRDRASFQYDLTEGLSTYEIGYKIPLNYEGTSFLLAYRNGDIRIVEQPFADVDIQAEANTFSLVLGQQIVSSLTTESSLSLSLDLSESKTSVSGQPFSLADGVQDGRSKLSVVRLEGNLIKRSDTDILLVLSQLSLGLDLFDATINTDAPDASFFSWLGRVQYAKALDRGQDIVLIARMTTQLTPNSLLPFEKFTLGGATTVRGYRHNRSIGDNGLTGTIALAFTVVENEEWGNLKLIPFVDLGKVWNSNGNFDQSLASTGLEINWQPIDPLSIRLDVAIPLTDVIDQGDSLSGNGIYFSLKWQN